MPSETDYAYAAGFFDGEGCITASTKSNGCVALNVSIGQRVVLPLQRIQQTFGGSLSFVENKHKGVWLLWWNNNDAYNALSKMLPYLVLKYEQARLAIEFVDLGKGQGVRLEDSSRTRRLAIVTELHRLKGA